MTTPLLALAGPTASGKSALALALAKALAPRVRLEFISMDSAQVYRGMDIGTAKPAPAERAAVPHHLIDLLEPTQAYSAARFVADALACAQAVRARGAVPLLVGGTLLYLHALVTGLARLPAADAALRAELDRRAAAAGWPALHAELARVDPATAARLAPHDAQRIQRALEVWHSSGRPMSAWLADAAPQAGTPVELLALEPGERGWLHQRIAQRFDTMLAAGFVDEVRALRSRGDLLPAMPSMRCVGYRQAWEALDAGDLAPLRERGIAATRQLAKRQLTWLRGMPRQVLACDSKGLLAQALAWITPRLPG